MLTRREAALLGMAAVASVPLADDAAAATEGTMSRKALLSHVDPQLQPFLRTLPVEPPITAELVRSWRQDAGAQATAALPTGVVARSIRGPRGASDVRIFVTGSSPGKRPRPGLLYMHGGGYISGSTASSWPGFSGCLQIAKDHDCVVVSVDYRLAPETRFPGSLEDNYAALKWLHANAESLGVDPARIAVMGESAGGGHAATLTIAARDRGEVPIFFQLLIYPMLDDRTGSTTAVPAHIGRCRKPIDSAGVPCWVYPPGRGSFHASPSLLVPGTSPDFRRRISQWVRSISSSMKTSSSRGVS
jgi:acetyl esterase/lipase